MKNTCKRPGRAGYISYVMVLSTGIVLISITFFSYKRAVKARDVQTTVQMRVDYSEKEDAILRSIVAITPNRAMRAMMSESDSSDTTRNPLLWRTIFSDALNMANARTSISAEVLDQLATPNLIMANVGDSMTNVDKVFFKVEGIETDDEPKTAFVTPGLDTSLGTGFPIPLQTNDDDTKERDLIYPIISTTKKYGALASPYLDTSADKDDPKKPIKLDPNKYKDFNLIPYPQINFGYAMPGQPFVAKRNWWAFEVDLAGSDRKVTKLSERRRSFVLSIYEIPSQLAISSSAFMSLGTHASGEEWQNVNIEGGVFAGRAKMEGSLNLASLSSRREMKFHDTASVGGVSSNNAFEAGTREDYLLDPTKGEFFPVSLASESGRVAFIPINRGAKFLDRYAHAERNQDFISNSISTTNWNHYSVGALQCAMSLDITAVDSNNKPTEYRFRAKPNIDFKQPTEKGINQPLPPGYTYCATEHANEAYDFEDQVVDIAYGANGRFYFESGVKGGVVNFNNARFGDPIVGVTKKGYYRPAAPFAFSQVTNLNEGTRWFVEFFPERVQDYLASLKSTSGMSDADGTSINHSISINVDYTTTGLNNPNFNPMRDGEYLETLPNGSPNYALIIRECSDFTDFEEGFSLVSNLRTYIGDDFNVVPFSKAPPDGYTPTGGYFPPISLFVPERRFGVEMDPYAISLTGQLGSLASENAVNPTHVIDSKGASGKEYVGNDLKVNLRPINHPAALPPVTMMNWLVVLEEMRPEHTAQ